MSDGRFQMRGRVFQARVFAPAALAGVINVTGDPKGGWRAKRLCRVVWASGGGRLVQANRLGRAVTARVLTNG